MFIVIKGRKIIKSIIAGVAVIALVSLIAINKNQDNHDKAIDTAAPITDWGMRYEGNGKTPVGNKSSEYLKEFDSYFLHDQKTKAGEKVLYLTFDAGYENGYTDSILQTLKKHEVPATFFLVGHYLNTQPELVKRMVAEGHIVGNHTFTHPDMSKISDKQAFKKELEKLEAKYKELTGTDMKKFYRPPGGKFSESNLRNAKEMGYKTFFWSTAYVDWDVNKQPTREQAFAKVLPRTHAGAIVLLHSTSKTNAEILDELLTKWKEQGYSFASLTDFE